eukprot:scaffold868_cov351-Pavlova_lutheri.AAC.11
MESLERIYIICPDRETGRISLLFADEKTTVMGEDQLFANGELFLDMEHAQYLTQKGNRVLNEGGWVRQQAVKLAASQMVETDFYIVLDSDNIAVRPMAYSDFVRDGRAVVNFDADMRRNGQFKEWWRWARDVLGVSLWNATYGVTPGVMNTNVVQQMLEYIEYRFGQRWTQVLLGGKLPWTEWGLYYTFAEASGMFESVHYACEGILYSYVVWARINYQDFDIASLFSQSYSLFTIVQSIGDISVYTVSQDFEPYIHSTSNPDRLDQDSSWALMRHLRDSAEDNATRRHKQRSDHTSGVDVLKKEVEVYACFVCSEEYALAAVVLAESVRKTKTSHQVVVFAPQGVIRGKIKALLEVVFDEFIEVGHIYNPNFERNFRERLLPDLMEQYPSWHPHDHQVHLYSKLNVFRLYKFSKIVYLDADTLVLRNIDELFYRPSLSAAPDVVPPDNFNTGVMVIRPSEQLLVPHAIKFSVALRVQRAVQAEVHFHRHLGTSLASREGAPFQSGEALEGSHVQGRQVRRSPPSLVGPLRPSGVSPQCDTPSNGRPTRPSDEINSLHPLSLPPLEHSGDEGRPSSSRRDLPHGLTARSPHEAPTKVEGNPEVNLDLPACALPRLWVEVTRGLTSTSSPRAPSETGASPGENRSTRGRHRHVRITARCARFEPRKGTRTDAKKAWKTNKGWKKVQPRTGRVGSDPDARTRAKRGQERAAETRSRYVARDIAERRKKSTWTVEGRGWWQRRSEETQGARVVRGSTNTNVEERNGPKRKDATAKARCGPKVTPERHSRRI